MGPERLSEDVLGFALLLVVVTHHNHWLRQTTSKAEPAVCAVTGPHEALVAHDSPQQTAEREMLLLQPVTATFTGCHDAIFPCYTRHTVQRLTSQHILL